MLHKNLLPPLLALLLLVLSVPLRADSFFMVVNKANPILSQGETAKRKVARLYLGERQKWPHGEEAKPIARRDISVAHLALLSEVLGMTQTELDRHWRSRKQTAGISRPVEIVSAGIALRMVAAMPGAFVMISANERKSLPEGVAILFEVAVADAQQARR